MSQVTLSVPTKKLPLLKNLLSSLRLENNAGRNFLQKTEFQSNSSTSFTEANYSFSDKQYSWEYFSNELEFE